MLHHPTQTETEREREREREKRVHVLTRSAGRLPQALTQALGTSEHGGRGEGKKGGGYKIQRDRLFTGVNRFQLEGEKRERKKKINKKQDLTKEPRKEKKKR